MDIVPMGAVVTRVEAQISSPTARVVLQENHSGIVLKVAATTGVEKSEKTNKPMKCKNHLEKEPEYLTTDLTAAERLLLEEFRVKWRSQPVVFQKLSSDGWRNVQCRFLELLPLQPDEMEAEFELRRDVFQWSYGTCSQYWSALIKAAEAVELPITRRMRAQAKIFNFMKWEESPKRPTTAASLIEIQEASLSLSPMASVALQISFELGQRLGDTLKLERCGIDKIFDDFTKTSFVTLTYRKGKTTRRRAPFTVHLMEHSTVGKLLLDYVPTVNELNLFGDLPQHIKILGEIRDSLSNVNAALGILSVRRGGLQAMALAGLSEAAILHHSRHSTRELLERYLEWGKLSLDAAREKYTTNCIQQQ